MKTCSKNVSLIILYIPMKFKELLAKKSRVGPLFIKIVTIYTSYWHFIFHSYILVFTVNKWKMPPFLEMEI